MLLKTTTLKQLKSFTSENLVIEEFNQRLLKAAKSGNTSDIMKVILQGANVNCRDSKGMTPLHIAAHYIKLDNAKALLKQGSDVKAMDKRGNTPLATLSGSENKDYSGVKLIDLLVEYGSDINHLNNDKYPPLLLNCYANNMDRFKALLKYHPTLVFPGVFNVYKSIYNFIGNDFGAVTNKYLNKALHDELFAAVRKGDVSRIKTLVEQGANVNFQDPNNGLNTSLITAVAHKQFACARQLIELGADLELANEKNVTPCISLERKGLAQEANMLRGFLKSFNENNQLNQTIAKHDDSAEILNF